MELGYQLDSSGSANLTQVPPERVAELLDRAERRLLVTILNQISLTDISIGPRDESLNQIVENLQKQVDRLDKRIAQLYGDAPLVAGTLRLDFAEKDSE